MSTRFDASDDGQREAGLSAATGAVRRGALVAFPTDTVYGVACDAFDADAVQRLLDAKGRGRDMPPPVLVSASSTLDALTGAFPEWARTMVERFWPGPLTLVCHQQASLRWDLGDTRGTVAVRMPDHALALELLQRTGPLAVSSANLSGSPAATDADQVEQMLGESLEVLLDGGPTDGETPSTIIDCTGDAPRLLRSGALPCAEIRAVLGEVAAELRDPDEPPADFRPPSGRDPQLSADGPSDGEPPQEGPAPGA